ncbi:heme-degrading domain-containing protein [Deinococcus hopiensis]|uniref:UPF0303 protein SAMN00790413_04220 n=1 Tax=Deinococcus hopiensis KR-140 TaxID=695939 RepID=A0A1W1UQK8_9DEIO|nr:heme-degrading domain-containing protein [Deinococcus hopiensis]SMB82984.1 Uncharacterized protein, UPF0303 family [Deinococcus hopiensis KR-140]
MTSPSPSLSSSLATQEQHLVFDRFDADTAWQIGTRLVELARTKDKPVVIDIRLFSHPLFYAALPNSTPDHAEWIRRKRNTVARFHTSSYGVGVGLRRRGTTLEQEFGLSKKDYIENGGSFPIRLRDSGVIGSITVSGLPEEEDHLMVVQVLCETLGMDLAALTRGFGAQEE